MAQLRESEIIQDVEAALGTRLPAQVFGFIDSNMIRLQDMFYEYEHNLQDLGFPLRKGLTFPVFCGIVCLTTDLAPMLTQQRHQRHQGHQRNQPTNFARNGL